MTNNNASANLVTVTLPSGIVAQLTIEQLLDFNAKAVAAAEQAAAKPGRPRKSDEEKAANREAKQAERRKEIDDLKAKWGEPAFNEPVSLYLSLKGESTGKEPKYTIYLADDEKVYLSFYAREMGWENPFFMTGTQVYVLHGVLKDDAHGVKVYSPRNTPATYYNFDDVVWEEGEPRYDAERDAERTATFRNRRKSA